MSAFEISLLTLVGINVVLALSLNLITGFCGQISLGHAAFYGTGAYCTAMLSVAGFPLAVALIAAALLAGVLGLGVGVLSLRIGSHHEFVAIRQTVIVEISISVDCIVSIRP